MLHKKSSGITILEDYWLILQNPRIAHGTPEAAQRLSRVLTNDPGTGVMRYADAAYDEAIECARQRGTRIEDTNAIEPAM